MADNKQRILKQGFLTKSPPLEASVLKKWQKRWFVLFENGTLEYYDKESKVLKEPPKGSIDMVDCSEVCEAQNECSEKYSLAIVTPKRTYLVKADTREVMLEWRKVLNAFVELPPPSARSSTEVYPERSRKFSGGFKRRSAGFRRKDRDPDSVSQSSHQAVEEEGEGGEEEEEEGEEHSGEPEISLAGEEVVVPPGELEHWKRECAEMKDKLTTIQAELARTRSGSLSSHHDDRERWEATLQEKARETEVLREQTKEGQDELRRKEAQLEAHCVKAEEHKVLEDSLRQEMNRFATEVTQLRKEQSRSREREEEWRLREGSLTQQVASLQHEPPAGQGPPPGTAPPEEQVASLEGELQRRKDSIIKLQVKRNRMENQYNESQRENRRLATEVDQLRAELGVAKSEAEQVSLLKAEVGQLQEQLSSVSREKEEGEERVKELQEEVEELRQPNGFAPASEELGASGEQLDGQVFSPILYLLEEEGEAAKRLHRTHPTSEDSHIPPVDRKYILEPWQLEHRQLDPIPNVSDLPPRPALPSQDVVNRLLRPTPFSKAFFKGLF